MTTAQRRELLHREQRGGGPADGPRFVLAHGFTQNIDCWGRFADRLADAGQVTLVDAPGHGRSFDDDADLDTAGRLLGEAGGRGVYVGYSMGGRTALHTALQAPDLVEGLVLIGATAGIDDEAARAERRAADEALAARLEADGLEAFLDRWLASPLFAGLDERTAARAARLTNRPAGLAASLRNCGTGTQEPLWDRLSELTMPMLAIAGDRDAKFTASGARLVEAATRSDASLITIPGTHAVHLEAPDACAEEVLAATSRWRNRP